MNIKYQNKVRLAKYIKDTQRHRCRPDVPSLTVQVKRLHEYKRQLLNILHVMYLIQPVKGDIQTWIFYPRTFIFGAKAAAGYYDMQS